MQPIPEPETIFRVCFKIEVLRKYIYFKEGNGELAHKSQVLGMTSNLNAQKILLIFLLIHTPVVSLWCR